MIICSPKFSLSFKGTNPILDAHLYDLSEPNCSLKPLFQKPFYWVRAEHPHFQTGTNTEDTTAVVSVFSHISRGKASNNHSASVPCHRPKIMTGIFHVFPVGSAILWERLFLPLLRAIHNVWRTGKSVARIQWVEAWVAGKHPTIPPSGSTYKNGLGCYYNQSLWALGYNGCITQVGTLCGLVQFCVLTATQGERVELRDILNNRLDWW